MLEGRAVKYLIIIILFYIIIILYYLITITLFYFPVSALSTPGKKDPGGISVFPDVDSLSISTSGVQPLAAVEGGISDAIDPEPISRDEILHDIIKYYLIISNKLYIVDSY